MAFSSLSTGGVVIKLDMSRWVALHLDEVFSVDHHVLVECYHRKYLQDGVSDFVDIVVRELGRVFLIDLGQLGDNEGVEMVFEVTLGQSIHEFYDFVQ